MTQTERYSIWRMMNLSMNLTLTIHILKRKLQTLKIMKLKFRIMRPPKTLMKMSARKLHQAMELHIIRVQMM